MFRKLKSKSENQRKLFYRLRENTTESSINTTFSYLDNVKEAKAIIETFIEQNNKYSIISSNAISHEVYGKLGIILTSDKKVLELDEKIYRLFKNKIEEKLNLYERNVIDSWGISSQTKINISYFLSGIETGKIVCDLGSVISVGTEVKSLNLNIANTYDMELLNYILECFFEEKQEYAIMSHTEKRQFYLICGERKLLFNFKAYDIISDKVLEFNKKLDNLKNGNSYTKKGKKRFNYE